MADDTTTPDAAPSVPARRRPTFADHMAAEKADPIAPLQVLGAGVRQAIDHEDYTRAFQLAETMLPYRHARLNAIAIGQGELFANGGEPIERDEKGRPVVTFRWADPVELGAALGADLDTIDMQPTTTQPAPRPELQAPTMTAAEVSETLASARQHMPEPGTPEGQRLAEAISIRRAELEKGTDP